jgi:alanine racemase
MNYLSYIVLSRENLLHNISFFRNLLGSGKKLAMVVKANAYGHGLREIISVAEDAVDYFQVDDIEELRLARECTNKQIFVLGHVVPKDLEELVALNGIPAVFDLERVSLLNQIGEKLQKKIVVHAEIDSFLGRLGVLPEDASLFLSEYKKFPFVEVSHIYAHFSDIEDVHNLHHATLQHEALQKVSESMSVPYHIAATSGILSRTDNWGGNMLRLGIGAYGLWPSERLRSDNKQNEPLKPVLSWKTKVAQVKITPVNFPIGYGKTFVTKTETKVAIIPQGYSDGFDRKFSNSGEVLIGGTRCKVLGRVAMNMFTVDVTHLPSVSTGDEVVLIGSQGNEIITTEELANKIQTINYEVVARLSPLLPRSIV